MYKYRYLVGYNRLMGGMYSEKTGHLTFYDHTPASFYWGLMFKSINRSYVPKFGWRGEKGVYVRIGDTFRIFFWKPYCPSWVNEKGEIIKSNKYQYLKFTLGHSGPRKGKEMNAIIESNADKAVDVDHVVLEVPFDTDGEGEGTQEEGVFVNDDGETRPVN